jgi:cytochrome c2
MSHRYFLPTLVLLSLAPFARAVDPSELKPGLVAYFVAGQARTDIPVTRLDPVPALGLKPGETPHPRMSGLEFGSWSGYLNVVRPGKYRFFANARGLDDFVVNVGDKVVLSAGGGAATGLVSGNEVELPGGVQKFRVEFTGGQGGAQFELLWQGPGFIREPLPHQFLGHLPSDRLASFARDVQLERGRFAFEELACIRCHKPAVDDKPGPKFPDDSGLTRMVKGLADRVGPNLTDVAKRDHAGWLDAWLADPAKLRPHTTMPKLFADDAAGKGERHAVVKYLVSLAGEPLERYRPPVASNEYRQSMERGKVLFTVTGCAACHTDPQPKKAGDDENEKPPLRPEDSFFALGTPHGPAAKYSLGALGSKFRPDTLAAFLQNPLKTHPAGRMPNANLNGQEAQDLARYLCRQTDDTIDPATPAAPKGAGPTTDAQWIDLGRKLVVEKGCVNCHAIEPGGKPLSATAKFPSLDDVRKAAPGKGCLDARSHAGKAPEYKLDANDSAALAAFLKDGLTGTGSPAPAYSARVALRRFNCLNCHSKDGEGGIPVELANEMRLLEKAENADDVRPPLLTGIGHKARTAWLKSVLSQGGRARPWMQLRMPQYGEPNVGFLPESLAYLEGTTPDDSVHKVALTPEKIQAGRQIVGKGGLGCISCHDIAGVPNTGTRGPDLATINQRVRYDWYGRWLHQPLRMAPGTRMPQAFIDGKSTLGTVLNGDPDAQAEAMWAYLSLGPTLPLPEGLEPPKGLIIAVKDRPELLRTFMPDAGSRAVAVGYPGGVSIAFSADQCRLTYAWSGNYLDASPVWNNRGGNPAKILGPKFWTAPPGHPWGLTVNPHNPPDFLGRANHPAFGMPLPLEPARIYDGPMAVQFDGYSIDKDGRPTFRYRLIEGKDAVLKIAETLAPLKTGVASGFTRRFEVEVPGNYQAWFLAGVSTKDARLSRADGGSIPLTRSGGQVTAPAAGVRVVLPDGDKATVLELANAPAGTTWRFVPNAGGYLAIVRLPESKTPQKLTFALHVWGLPKDDDDLLRGLEAK